MALYELTQNGLERLERTTFSASGVKERTHLQQVLKQHIDVISPNTLVIAEEFGNWDDSRRRIDLLGIDKDAKLVVIELKRTEDGGHMELQALRYAAMVSAMTFEDAVDTYNEFLLKQGSTDSARDRLLEFLGGDEADADRFTGEVRILLVAAEFSKEITTSVLWLNDCGLDITCVQLRPHRDGSRLLLDIQQTIPLPQAMEYQIKLREKARLERVVRTQNRDMTRYDVVLGDTTYTDLPKRRAIFALIRYLCSQGVSPEEINSLIEWRSNAVRKISGRLQGKEFERKLADQLIEEGNQPDTSRFFIGDDELLYADGQTYAVTKMWGQRTAEAMDLLVKRFPHFKIGFREHLE